MKYKELAWQIPSYETLGPVTFLLFICIFIICTKNILKNKCLSIQIIFRNVSVVIKLK